MYLTSDQFLLISRTINVPVKAVKFRDKTKSWIRNSYDDYEVLLSEEVLDNPFYDLLLRLAIIDEGEELSEIFIDPFMALHDICCELAGSYMYKSDEGMTKYRANHLSRDLIIRLSIEAYITDKYHLYLINPDALNGAKLGIKQVYSQLDYIEPVIRYLLQESEEGYGDEEGDLSDGEGKEVKVSELLSKLGEKKESDLGASESPKILSQPELLPEIDPVEEFKKFLSALIDRRKRFQIDSLKHYNRNSRNTRELMYSSISKKVKTGQAKLGILVDVSGSMDISVISAGLESLQDILPLLDRESRVVAWDTEFQGEWDLYSLPKSIEGRGGTDLLPGIKYMRDKGYKIIVVFSDFCTINQVAFLNYCKKVDARIEFYPVNSEDYEGLIKSHSEASKFLNLYKKLFG